MAENEQEPAPLPNDPLPDSAPPPSWPPPPPEAAWPPPPSAYGVQPIVAPPVNATLILALGILSIVLTLTCGFGGILGIIAWVLANQAFVTLDRVGDPLAQRGTVNAGRICGIVGTALMAVGIIFYVIYFVFLMGVGVWGAAHTPSPPMH